MIDVNKIQTALMTPVPLIGVRQPINPNYAIIDSTNQLSFSGYFVNDNQYAKIEFIKDNQDYKDISDAQFNEMLRTMQTTSIVNVCNQVFSDFDFIDTNVLFKNAFNKTVAEDLPIGFVGERIRITNEKNIGFTINKVILDFEGTGDFTLFLWNTSKKVFIKEKEITITTDHQEVILDWIVDDTDSIYKGDYYIGYINDGLTVKPYSRQYQNGNLRTNFTYLCIEPVKVVNHLDSDLFDLNLVDGLSENTGLNFDITVFEDYTNLVINNKRLFANAIKIDMIIQCMQLYLSSVRHNRNQMVSEEMYDKVLAEIEGTNYDSVIKVKGLKNQLIGEITSIREEILKLKKGFFKTGQLLTSTLK